MMRRLPLAFFFLIFCASSAWPKWKEEEQQYLDNQFQGIQDQVRALKTQVDTLTASLAELRQSQSQFQAALVRQIRAMQDMQQLLSSLRINGEENYSGLKSALNQLRAETQKSFSTLIGQPAAPAPGVTETATGLKPPTPSPATPQVIQGYVTVVEGNTITVDLGSSRGVHPGSHLAVYKAGDANTRVGVLEVTQVLDADNSRARIVTMNPGVRPEFSDLVRVE